MELTNDLINYLNSKEVRKELKISACDLSHLRMEGKLKFKKVGNAYLYEKECVEKLTIVVRKH